MPSGQATEVGQPIDREVAFNPERVDAFGNLRIYGGGVILVVGEQHVGGVTIRVLLSGSASYKKHSLFGGAMKAFKSSVLMGILAAGLAACGADEELELRTTSEWDTFSGTYGTVECGDGYELTGGGCVCFGSTSVLWSSNVDPGNSNAWECECTSSNDAEVWVEAICAKVS